jgi:hypothetical protein
MTVVGAWAWLKSWGGLLRCARNDGGRGLGLVEVVGWIASLRSQ